MDNASKAGFLISHSDPLPTSHSSWPVVLLPLSFSYVPDSLTHARPRQKHVGEARVMKDQSKRVWGTVISTCGFRMNLITRVDAFAGNKGGWAVFIGVIIYNEKDQHWRRPRCEGPRWDALEGFSDDGMICFHKPQVMGLRVTCPFTQEDVLQDYYKSEWEHCMRHCLTLHLWGQNSLVLALSPLLLGQSVKCSQRRGKVRHLCVNSMEGRG